MTNSKLTWQPGADGRKGRWKKKYRGQTHYFSGGRGRSDREAKRAAQWAWEKLKQELDENAPKRHQAEYEAALSIWSSVLSWCRKHGESTMAGTAESKIEKLTQDFASARPKVIAPEDLWENQFDWKIQHPRIVEGLNSVAKLVEQNTGVGSHETENVVEVDSRLMLIDPRTDPEFTRLKWDDRLNAAGRSTTSPSKRLWNVIDRFVQQKTQDAVAGQLSASRPDKLRSHLRHFAKWFGSDTSITDIDGAAIAEYRKELLRLVETGKWRHSTIKDRLGSIRSFIRWLWQMDLIPAMPKIMDGASAALRIDTPDPEIVTYTLEEIATLIEAAKGPTKLFVLLMLNIGCTQKDIADLRQDEVDWDHGRVIRKRSKTRKFKSIPTVNYKLWDEVFSLLKKHRDSRSELVLVNRNGRPLVWDEVGENGKRYKKNDSVKNRFDRLRSGVGIRKSLRHLKKTSASMIRGNPRYASLESLFLGHAPQTISDKHYAAPPQELLDEAIMWLGERFGVVKKADA